MIYAKYNADNNKSNRSMFEFKFNWSDNGGSNVFNIDLLRDLFDSAPNQYGLRIELIPDANGTIYTVEGTSETTVIFIVEKNA